MGQRLELPEDIEIKIGGGGKPGFFSRVFSFIGNAILVTLLLCVAFVFFIAYDENVASIHDEGRTVTDEFGDEVSRQFRTLREDNRRRHRPEVANSYNQRDGLSDDFYDHRRGNRRSMFNVDE